MALGDKRPVVMEADRGIAGGVATLGEDGILSEEQRPGADGLLLADGTSVETALSDIETALAETEEALASKADTLLSNITDPATALTNIGAASNPNLLDNWYFPDP